MKQSDKSAIGRQLASLRKSPHKNNSAFFRKMRREQERERKKLGIRFEGGAAGRWCVIAMSDDNHLGNVVHYDNRWWVDGGGVPHRTRLEAAKELLSTNHHE